MSNNSGKREDKKQSYYKNILAGYILQTVMFVLLTVGFAAAVLKSDISQSVWLPCELIFGVICGVSGGFICVRPVKCLALPLSAASGALSGITVFLALLIANGAKTGAISLILLIIMILSSVIGGISAVTLKKKTRYR